MMLRSSNTELPNMRLNIELNLSCMMLWRLKAKLCLNKRLNAKLSSSYSNKLVWYLDTGASCVVNNTRQPSSMMDRTTLIG